MELEKIRNLSDGELVTEEQKAAEQLFRLRFQMKLGQNEGVKKLREIKKDVARFKTIARERELGLHGETHKSESSLPKKAAKKTAKSADAKVTKKAAAGSATKSKKEAR